MSSSNAYTINGLITNDPLEQIFKKYKDTIFYEYVSYSLYFSFLAIIGTRIKDNYIKIDRITSSVNQATDKQINGFPAPELDGLLAIQGQITKEIQLDQESFVIFSKILLDKFGILVEKLSNVKTNSFIHSFTDHKKWFIKNNIINAPYSQLLLSIHWYDQFLDVMRNKIIEHGGALSTMIRTGKNGIVYSKKRETFGVPTPRHQIIIQNLIVKYGKINETIGDIPLNPFTMLDDLLMRVLDLNIQLDKKDLDDLGLIVKNSGGVIDAVILAKHLRKFIQDSAALFV